MSGPLSAAGTWALNVFSSVGLILVRLCRNAGSVQEWTRQELHPWLWGDGCGVMVHHAIRGNATFSKASIAPLFCR